MASSGDRLENATGALADPARAARTRRARRRRRHGHVASGEGAMNALDVGDRRGAVAGSTISVAQRDPDRAGRRRLFGRPGAFVASMRESASQLWTLPIDGGRSKTATDGRTDLRRRRGKWTLTAIDLAARTVRLGSSRSRPVTSRSACPPSATASCTSLGRRRRRIAGACRTARPAGAQLWRYARRRRADDGQRPRSATTSSSSAARTRAPQGGWPLTRRTAHGLVSRHRRRERPAECRRRPGIRDAVRRTRS